MARPGGATCARAVPVAVLLLVLSACGRNSSAPVGQVKGTVSHGGEPLKSDDEYTWSVIFVGQDGSQVGGAIGRDGSYSVKDVAPGPARISIVGNPRAAFLTPDKRQSLVKSLRERVASLERYKDADRSGLTFTVNPGMQHHDIAIPR